MCLLWIPFSLSISVMRIDLLLGIAMPKQILPYHSVCAIICLDKSQKCALEHGVGLLFCMVVTRP